MTGHDPHAPAGRARRHPIHPDDHREEVIEMPKNAIRYVSAIHADRAARFQAEAHHARVARRASRDERRIRRAVGRSIVRVGARIAADPALERLQPAGSR
jgi:hypothetical protein